MAKIYPEADVTAFCKIGGLMKVLVGIFFFVLLPNPVPAGGAPAPEAYSLNFAWAPSPGSGVAGYHVYHGTNSGDYTDSIFVVGNVTTATISGLSGGITNYFAITVSDLAGKESARSTELNYLRQLPAAQMQIQGMSAGKFMLTVNGPTGHTYELEATEDFITWTIIGTVTLAAGGSLNFTDTHAADFPRRFYRTLDTQP